MVQSGSFKLRKSKSHWNSPPSQIEIHAGFPIKPIYKPVRILSLPDKEEFIRRIIIASTFAKNKNYVK